MQRNATRRCIELQNTKVKIFFTITKKKKITAYIRRRGRRERDMYFLYVDKYEYHGHDIMHSSTCTVNSLLVIHTWFYVRSHPSCVVRAGQSHHIIPTATVTHHLRRRSATAHSPPSAAAACHRPLLRSPTHRRPQPPSPSFDRNPPPPPLLHFVVAVPRRGRLFPPPRRRVFDAHFLNAAASAYG